MIEIARQTFASLWREHAGYYIILHDGYFERDFCAANDAEAIRLTGWHIPTYDREVTG